MATIDDIVNNEQILEIANAIRKVTRTSDPMTVPQMPKRLMEIRATETIEKIISFSSPSPVSLGLYDKEFSHLFVITPKTSNDALLLKRIKPEIQLDVDIEVGEIFLNYKDSQDIELNLLIMDLLLPSSEETKGFLILQGESDIIEPYNTEKSYSKGELFTINKGTDENPIFAIGVTTVSHGREEYNPEHNNILTNQIYDTTTNEYKDLYEVLDSLTELIETKVDKVENSRLMTDLEGTKLANIEEYADVNVLETVKVDNVALTVEDKAVNIDLSGKVDKTTTGSTRRVYGVNALNEQELTDIEATPTNESIKLVTSGGIYSALDGKVDKVEDYGLSKNDYTDTDAEKVSKIVIDGDGDKALLNDGSYGEVGKVDTVNDIGPDENKNIEITGENIHLKDITTKTLTKGIEDIETNIGDIEFTLSTLAGLGGDLAAYNFNIATPTQQQLNDYALSQIPSISDPNDIFNNTRVKNLFDGNVWRLTNTPNTEPPVFEWINIGPDMIAPATDLTYGSVMGNDNISFTNGLPTVLKSADADKLGGEAPSYYAKASDLSDKVDKITLGSVRRVYGVNEFNEQEATEVEGTPTEDSTKLVTSGGVFTAIDNLDLGEVNIIEEIKVDNVKQTVTDKSVNIDLSGKEDKLPDAPEEDPQDYYLGYDESGNKIAKKVVISGGSYKSNIYFSNEDSDVIGYKKLSNKVDDTLTVFEKTAQASTSPKLIEKFLFDLPVGTDVIEGGDWMAHINCRVDNTDNATRFLFKPFVYHEEGTESYLFTSDDNGVQSAPIKNVAFDWLEIMYASEQIDILPTDRIGVEVYIATTRPSATKLEFRVGNGYASHVNLPLAFRHSELRDLDGDINYQHITLAEKQRLANIESGAEVNKIDTINVDNTALTITDKTVNIDLSGKVDKVEDYGLSKNDYTDTDAEKVSKIEIDGDGDKALLNDGSYGEVGKVDTVNNIGPDENKNITITADDIPDTSTTNKFATSEQLTQIATNTGDITDLQDDKVDKVYSTDYAYTDGLVVTWKGATNTYRVGDGTTTNGNGYTGTATEIIISKFFDDGVHGIAPIDEIGYRTFIGKTTITSVKIPISVTNIEQQAFYDCSSLTSITIPSSVTSIGSNAFYNCSSLTSIEIPSSVTSIGSNAFYNCSSLTSITIPSSVTSIGIQAFYNCSSLTSIDIPSNVTSIRGGAFYGCSSLTEMTVLATTPPTLSNTNAISTATTVIYVPYSSLTAYKNATNWSTYADRIFAIPEGKWISESIDGNTASISSLNTNKADKATTISGYGIADAYTKTEIESKIASVYKYKGSVANYASLPTADLEIGYVYNVEDTGDNYAWTGTEWDKLSGTVDLSGYATKLSISQWHVPYRDEAGSGEPNTSKLATMTSPLPSAILIRDTEGKATFVGGTSANQGIVKSQLDNAIANMVTTNTDQTIPGVKTFSNNIIGNLQGNASSSTYCSRLRGVDTRDTNETPEWYYTGSNKSANRQSFLSEFKTTSVLGLSGSTYCLLLTCVPWADETGGLPSQTAYLSNGKKYARYATSTTTWSAWEKEATTQSYTTTLSSSGWTGSSAPYSKEITVSGILATDKATFEINFNGVYDDELIARSNLGLVYKYVTSANTITFYSDAIPTADIPLTIKVVR